MVKLSLMVLPFNLIGNAFASTAPVAPPIAIKKFTNGIANKKQRLQVIGIGKIFFAIWPEVKEATTPKTTSPIATINNAAIAISLENNPTARVEPIKR